jgi:general secretion pathway protein I
VTVRPFSRFGASAANLADRRGFTLIEMLVALAVFSLVALTMIRLASENTRTAVHVENRLLAGIIAENLAVEAFASPNPPDMGLAQGDIDMAGRRWSWRRTVSPTDQAGLVRMDVAVLLEGQETATLTLVRDTGA